MNKNEIIQTIERIINDNKVWTVGITDDPDLRKDEYGNPKHWYQWRADCKEISRKVEEYFIYKSMKGVLGGGKNPNYVYVFLK